MLKVRNYGFHLIIKKNGPKKRYHLKYLLQVIGNSFGIPNPSDSQVSERFEKHWDIYVMAARDLLRDYWARVELIAEALYEQHRLTYDQVIELIEDSLN